MGDGVQEKTSHRQGSAAMRAVRNARLHSARMRRTGNAGRSADAARARRARRGDRAHDDHGERPLRCARDGGALPPQRRVHRRQRARGHQRRPRRLHADLSERDRRAVRERRDAHRRGADRSLAAGLTRLLQLRRGRRHHSDRRAVRALRRRANQRPDAAHLRRQFHPRQQDRRDRRVLAAALRC